jgi:hypothetical protein
MQVMDHDELITSLVKTRDETDRARVARAFVVSLRAKRFDLRSPLGSYAFHLHHPPHRLDGFNPAVGQVCLACRLCPYYSNEGDRTIRLDPGESIRKGPMPGENYASPAYALRDLMLFSETEVPPPDRGDWDLLRELFQRVRDLPDGARLTDLNKALTGLFKSNKWARQEVLEILGFCGVLQSKKTPPVFHRFFCRDGNQFHPHFHTRDWAYPVSWWTGADAVNEEAVTFWFPEI